MGFIRSLEYVLIIVKVYWNYYFCLSRLVYKMPFFIYHLDWYTDTLFELKVQIHPETQKR